MKYINQLDDLELVELIKDYIWGEFKKVVEVRRDIDNGCIDMILMSESEDDEAEDGTLILEDMYTLTDYDVKVWDFQLNESKRLRNDYRSKLFNKFGNEYAVDYLFN